MTDRTTYIGSSDVAAILGVSPWKSAFLLYQEKIGAHAEEITPAKQKLFDRGNRWEPIVVEMLVDELRERGHEVKILAQRQRYRDAENGFIAAEIDVELLVDGEEVNGEAKTVNPFAAKLWGDEETGEVPIYYQAQVMHGLMVKPRRRAIVAALTGFDDRPRIHWIDRDEEIITHIRAREIEFWERVQARNPPDPTTPEDIKWLYPKDAGTICEADDSLFELCQKLKDLKANVEFFEEKATDVASQIKARMAEAATLIYQGQTLATWKTQSTNRLDTKAFAAAFPEIDKNFRKTTDSRVFRLK